MKWLEKGLPVSYQKDCHHRDLSQEQWEQCLFECIRNGDAQQFNRLWEKYPELAQNMMREFEEMAAKSDNGISAEDASASWKRFAERMKEEGVEGFLEE